MQPDVFRCEDATENDFMKCRPQKPQVAFTTHVPFTEWKELKERVEAGLMEGANLLDIFLGDLAECFGVFVGSPKECAFGFQHRHFWISRIKCHLGCADSPALHGSGQLFLRLVDFGLDFFGIGCVGVAGEVLAVQDQGLPVCCRKGFVV